MRAHRPWQHWKLPLHSPLEAGLEAKRQLRQHQDEEGGNRNVLEYFASAGGVRAPFAVLFRLCYSIMCYLLCVDNLIYSQVKYGCYVKRTGIVAILGKNISPSKNRNF